ncbi:16S rRNA (guanine(966)-N(2))-methyltransferase RsmD [Chryseobacterium sp.]|uniref:16S rRNA (guanine(966)-N(2))-methyltransferase RsmD n=1 Tax=Chryseobacterium sp. TaxID=1871047 RepID=UPI0011C6ED3B|nr:16S rRNA (guanine(966)-N(2))-methyltransferase RsmD [Chryseobacterium sp.]TXF75196.1 16S rRNA (guanine(966)-N(2))-methyltransferase RsmD [Chryseobacterium sp.]
MYRIISGKWKSKRIAAPKNFDVRPTTDFAKEALFSIIENRFGMDITSSSVLDLFAGIGSISLEFTSRGCQDVTSIEMNARHAGFISSTATELEMDKQINVQRGDVFEYLKKNRKRKSYEIIVADPPFETEQNKYEELISLVLNNPYLKPNGLFILEHQSRTKLEHPNLLDTRKYGNVSFSFFKANEPKSEEEVDKEEPENSDAKSHDQPSEI